MCIIKINCLYIEINAKLACCVRTLDMYSVAGHENNSSVKCVFSARELSNLLPEPTVTYFIDEREYFYVARTEPVQYILSNLRDWDLATI